MGFAESFEGGDMKNQWNYIGKEQKRTQARLPYSLAIKGTLRHCEIEARERENQ